MCDFFDIFLKQRQKRAHFVRVL